MNRSPFQRNATAISLAFAVWFAAPAWGQAQVLQKVLTPPPLTPLKLSVGGRVLTEHGAGVNGLDSEDYVSQWPGSYFEARFKGTEVYFRVGMAHEILHIVVDGRAAIPLPEPDAGVYRLSGLDEGPHAVGVYVVTESQGAPNHFGGFGIPARETALAPVRRIRQIEFIGDSHTVGYGNTSTKRECTSDEVDATTDNAQSFAGLTASHYHADYQVNAISGHGIVRNYNGGAGDPVPVAYPYVLFDRKQLYNDPAWKPQVIVIALGTNDFSTPLNAGEKWKTRDELHTDFETTYVRFIQSLRARNPDAFLILWATELADGEIEAEVKKVMEQAKAQGEKRIAFVPVEHLAFTGCHYHPSVADDKAIRDKLVETIDGTRGIWQGK